MCFKNTYLSWYYRKKVECILRMYKCTTAKHIFNNYNLYINICWEYLLAYTTNIMLSYLLEQFFTWKTKYLDSIKKNVLSWKPESLHPIISIGWYLWFWFMVFNATFNNISVIYLVVSFIGGGNRCTRRKAPICLKSPTNFSDVCVKTASCINIT